MTVETTASVSVRVSDHGSKQMVRIEGDLTCMSGDLVTCNHIHIYQSSYVESGRLHISH